jgi:hypothetical protein
MVALSDTDEDEMPFTCAQPSGQRNYSPPRARSVSRVSSSGKISLSSFDHAHSNPLVNPGEETDIDEEPLQPQFVKPTTSDLSEVIDCLVAILGPCDVTRLGLYKFFEPNVDDDHEAVTPFRCPSPVSPVSSPVVLLEHEVCLSSL